MNSEPYGTLSLLFTHMTQDLPQHTCHHTGSLWLAYCSLVLCTVRLACAWAKNLGIQAYPSYSLWAHAAKDSYECEIKP